MNKFILLSLLGMFLLSTFVSADVISINSGGSQEIVISNDIIEGFYGQQKGYYNGTINDTTRYTGVSPPIIPEGVNPYDVIVNLKNPRYEVGSDVTVEIILINTGDTPDNDAILSFYLVSPDEHMYDSKREILLEVGPGETTIERTLTLPTTSELGDWRFEVVYDLANFPAITSHDSFEVVENLAKSDLLKVVALVGIIMFLIFISEKNKKKKNYNEDMYGRYDQY